MKRIIVMVAAVAAVLTVYAGSASASTVYHVIGPNGSSACMNVTFPQSDFFGPGLGAPNAIDEDTAALLAAPNNGEFRVGYVADGHTDLVAKSSPYYDTTVVGATSSDGENRYVRVDQYTLVSGPCPPPPAAKPRAEDSVFLCYSQWQIDPGVWTMSMARRLFDSGYWLPVAETSIPTSTKVGRFYLFCNGTRTGSAQLEPVKGVGVDDGGNANGDGAMEGFPFYPLAVAK